MADISESELLAFARGELTATARRRLESRLDRSPSDAAVVAELARMFGSSRDALRSTLAGNRADRDLDHVVVEPGVRVGRYVVESILGVGGMGVVYRARDPALARQVALKLIRPSVVDAQRNQARLLREARALALVEHPNVVKVYDAGSHEGAVYIAMELVEGETLTKHVSEHGPDWPRILEMFRDAGQGLAAAHRAGIVHRDFKPDNVLVDRQGRARVTDFGLAHPEVVDSETIEPTAPEGVAAEFLTLTRTGMVVGTPVFMPPEQMRGGDVDRRADQFSFCVALYMMLYAQRPFFGNSVDELLQSVMQGAIAPFPSKPAVPTWLKRAIVRGLQAYPAARWPSMDHLLEAIDPSRWRRRRRSIAALGGVGLFVIGSASALSVPLDHDPCIKGAARIDEVWSPEHRERVRESLRAHANPESDAPERVVARLERAATDWRTRYPLACAADRQPSSGAERLCLDRWLGGFSAMVPLLEQADAKVAARSMDIALGLGDIRECVEGRGPESSPAPPPEYADAIARAEALLDRSHVLAQAGRTDDAAALVEVARRTASEFEYQPLTIATLRSAAHLHEMAGRFEQAERTFVEAYALAHAHGHDHVAANTAVDLVHLLGGRLFRIEDAYAWIRHAQSLIARLPNTRRTAMLSTKLLVELSNLANHRGEYAVAQMQLELALVNAEAMLGPDDHRVSNIVLNLANAHFGQGRFAQAVELYERTVRIRRATFGEHHPSVADALTNLASATKRLGDADRALQLYFDAEAIYRGALGPDHPSVGMVGLNIAAMFESMHRLDDALDRYRSATELLLPALGTDHPWVHRGRYNTADLLRRRGDLRTAELWARQAVEASVNHRKTDPGSYLGAGIVLSDILEAQGRTDDRAELLGELQAFAARSLPAEDDQRIEIEQRLAAR